MKQFLFLILLASVIGINAQSKEELRDADAIEAVTGWLKIVDQGEYEKSWKEGAAIFQKAVSADQWKSAVENAREPFGKLIEREVKNKKFSTSIPGMPDGDYYSIEFSSSFENKNEAIETVGAMVDDGKWKVIGYFIY